MSPSHLPQLGSVVWAELADVNGVSKVRPAVVVTPTADIVAGQSLRMVAVTTRIPTPRVGACSISERLMIRQCRMASERKSIPCNDFGMILAGCLHTVSLWAADTGLTLGQVAVDDKSNEITAIPKLLQMLDLEGALVTIDAMGCQKDIARQIRTSNGHYLLAVKEN